MTEYYKNQLDIGQEYQDFVKDVLFDKLGWIVQLWQSKIYQFKGENKTGIEIKYNSKLSEMQRIYIELYEKTKSTNTDYIESGILRDDNTWLYLCGDYKRIFIFPKRTLKALYERGEYKLIENKYKTSKGYTMPINDCIKYSIRDIII